MIRTYLICIFIGCAIAQNCPGVTVKSDFDLNKYAGVWYEIEYHDNYPKGPCISLTYEVYSENNFNKVFSKKSLETGEYILHNDTGSQHELDKAQLVVLKPEGTVQRYWIVDTDYKSFAIVRRCDEGMRGIWLLARERHPAQSVLEEAYAVLDRNGFSRSYFKTSDQENCD